MTDIKRTIREIDGVAKENEDRLVFSPGSDDALLAPATAWARDPGEDVKRVERTKQHLAREARQLGEDPAPNVSDDALLRRLGLAE